MLHSCVWQCHDQPCPALNKIRVFFLTRSSSVVSLPLALNSGQKYRFLRWTCDISLLRLAHAHYIWRFFRDICLQPRLYEGVCNHCSIDVFRQHLFSSTTPGEADISVGQRSQNSEEPARSGDYDSRMPEVSKRALGG